MTKVNKSFRVCVPYLVMVSVRIRIRIRLGLELKLGIRMGGRRA